MTENTTPEAGAPLGALGTEVEESLHPLLQWIVSNVKIIVGGIAALIVIVGGMAVYDSVRATRVTEKRAELTSILALSDASKRAEGLAQFAADAPEALAVSVRLELAASLSEAGQHDRAAQIWSELGPQNLGSLSGFGSAAELSRAGKHTEALAVLEGMRADIPKAYRMLLLERLAYEAELAGNAESAIGAWEALLAENQSGSTAFISAKIKDLRASQDKKS